MTCIFILTEEKQKKYAVELYSDKYQDNDNKNDLIDNEVLIN